MEENPVGVRFFPTDEQIFSHYLKKKILDPTDVSVQSVNEVDLLKFEPWDLRWQSARQREDEDRYFFWSPELYGNSRSTKKRTKKNGEYCNKERYKRSTAAGYWKSTGEETEIKGYGVKRILVFHKRNRDSKTEVKTDYVMHEYDPSDIPDNKKRFVFLRLKRNWDDKLISSSEVGQQSQYIRSSSPAEGQPNQHQLANLPPRYYQIFSEFEKLLRVNKVEKFLENVYTSFCDQGQPNQHLTFDFGDAFSEDNGLKVDPRLFSGSETHGGGNRSDHIYSAPVPPPNRPEYESSNSKRFNSDFKSIFSEHETHSEEFMPGIPVTNTDANLMGEGIFSVQSREY